MGCCILCLPVRLAIILRGVLYICHDDLQEQDGTVGNVFEGRPKESSLVEKEGNLLFACIFCLLGMYSFFLLFFEVLTLQCMNS